MLFDLQGKRRRVVQATYLTLAVLMGGGLVLFGIGGDVSGGLFDAFSDRTGGSGGSDVVEERVDRNEERIKRRPQNAELRAELVRDYYSLASVQTPQGVTSYPQEARDELNRASVHWDAYLDITEGKRVDPTVASIALRLYDQSALNKPEKAVDAARVIAARGKDGGSYLQLMQYAAIAGDNRTARLAEAKALDLARNAEERRAIRDAIKQVEQQVLTQQIQSGQVDLQTGAGKGNGQKQGGGGQ